MPGLLEACTSPSPLWPRVIAYYSDTARSDAGEMHHNHPNCELIYVFSGSCYVETAQIAADMHTGDYFFLDANVPHTVRIRPCTMLIVEFTLEPALDFYTVQNLYRSSECFRQMVRYGEHSFSGDDPDGELFRALDALVQGVSSPGTRDACLGRSEMAVFLTALGQSFWENRNRVRGDRYMRRTMLFIRQNFHLPITVREIAAHCGVSPDHLGRVFRAGTGQTIHAFLMRTRCEHAATMLLGETESTDEIARQCGFSSRQQFDRDFSRLYKLTPAQYRRQHQRIEHRHLWHQMY